MTPMSLLDVVRGYAGHILISSCNLIHWMYWKKIIEEVTLCWLSEGQLVPSEGDAYTMLEAARAKYWVHHYEHPQFIIFSNVINRLFYTTVLKER